MPTPIPELIAAEIVSRLEEITTANGYAFTIPFVRRVNRDGRNWTPQDNAIAVMQSGDEQRLPDMDCPGNPPANAYQQTWEIRGYVRQSESTFTAEDTQLNQMTASIRKAIAENSGNWVTMGGNSFNAMFGSSRIEKSAEHTVAVVELDTMYRISELDPFTARN